MQGLGGDTELITQHDQMRMGCVLVLYHNRKSRMVQALYNLLEEGAEEKGTVMYKFDRATNFKVWLKLSPTAQVEALDTMMFAEKMQEMQRLGRAEISSLPGLNVMQEDGTWSTPAPPTLTMDPVLLHETIKG